MTDTEQTRTSTYYLGMLLSLHDKNGDEVSYPGYCRQRIMREDFIALFPDMKSGEPVFLAEVGICCPSSGKVLERLAIDVAEAGVLSPGHAARVTLRAPRSVPLSSLS